MNIPEKENVANSLDNKAGVFIAAIVALMTVYVQIIPFDKFVKSYGKATKLDACLLTISLLALAFGLCIIAWSFYSFYKAMRLKDFQGVNLDNLTDINILSAAEDEASEAMIRHYNDVISHNRKANDDKAYDIQVGLRKCLCGFALVSIATAMTCIVVGGFL